MTMMMKIFLLICAATMFFFIGCEKTIPDHPHPNQPPRTYLWLFPDSGLYEGPSKQHIRWWGDDADGIVKGYMFAAGKLFDSSTHQISDTVGWRWRLENDTLIAFPLYVKRDTFQVAVRAVDNTFPVTLPDGALLRLTNPPYWDKNENGIFDSGDVSLPSLKGSYDPRGALLGIPVLNQPPTITFVQDPNDPSVLMQQPETTYTAVTFSWIGSDPDGDQTIRQYEMALNDTTDQTRWIAVPGNIRLVSLVVPRTRSDGATGEVTADVYSGTFLTTTHLLGTISHMKLDTFNVFYVRARDIAGDSSSIIQMPAKTAPRKWFVKKPRGKLLIVNDFINNVSGNRDAVLAFYKSKFDSVSVGGEMGSYDVLDIGRYNAPVLQWALLKRNGQFGVMVPPFIDPALIFTFHLFDVVFWYTDIFPSLGVAQFPLFEYVRDPNHRGKVIFSTMFFTASDPRGALKDFAPIDSVSSVDLATPSRPLPTSGDNRIPGGYEVFPDSSDATDIYPAMRFNSGTSSLYMRPIYRRTDAKYIYKLQEDDQSPQRYVNVATLSELRSISAIDSETAWTCGLGGIIFYTSNAGVSWTSQTSGTTNSLSSINFVNADNGHAVGDVGTILRTTDGGKTWTKKTLSTENYLAVYFSTPTTGTIVGTDGILVRTTDGGSNWVAPSTDTYLTQTIRSVHFVDANVGLAVGDNGLIIKTTDSGASWRLIHAVTTNTLNAVRFVDAATAWAVGASGTNLKTTDAGETWTLQSVFASSTDLRSIYFIDNSTGWICGSSGLMFTTQDGGGSWSIPVNGSGVNWNLNNIIFVNSFEGWSVGAGGMILRTENSGGNWFAQPRGKINVGVVDGVGTDGRRSFVFLGLPLHLLNGDGSNVKSFLEYILSNEFGE